MVNVELKDDREAIKEANEKAWSEARFTGELRNRDGLVINPYASCDDCFKNWRGKGAIDENKPLRWPPSFVGKPCERCGAPLKSHLGG